MSSGAPERLLDDTEKQEERAMRKLVVSEFITVDGVIEDPGGAEGAERGGWAFRFDRGPEGDAFKLDELKQAGTLLLGRRTYEGFAAAWPSRTDDVGFAEKMNSIEKAVVSGALERLEWSNSRLLEGDLGEAVAGLKREAGGEILVNGSARLVRALEQQGLIDEYRLMVFPVVLGAGERLFAEEGTQRPLRLSGARQAGQCLIVTYERP
jgi:dihydrofolate reductase